MPSTNSVNRARTEGYEQGRADAIQHLRAFTGVRPFAPDLDQPEHRAYPEYLAQLTRALAVARERAEDSLIEIHKIVDRIAAAEEHERRILDERREDRSTKNPLAQLADRVGDFALPISKEIRTLRKGLARQEAWRVRCLDDAERYGTEASKVARWVDDCMAEMEQARAARDERIDAERRESEHGERDVSPRWCRTFRHEDFTAEDPRRCGAFTFAGGLRDVAGADFGYRWRRDVDEQDGVDGRWALHHIQETNETILEFQPRSPDSAIWLLGDTIESFDEAMDVFLELEQRQNERNSLALVLDAYEEHRAVKAHS